MEIKIRLRWELSGNLLEMHGEIVEKIIPERTSIRDLLSGLGIPTDKIGIIAVNGSLQKIDYILIDKDYVQLYPPLEGG